MSKIGRKKIQIPSGLTVGIADGFVNLSGSFGKATLKQPIELEVGVTDGYLWVKPKEGYLINGVWGLFHRTLTNAITGVTTGYKKQLELSGVGYRAKMEGDNVSLTVGFSHPVKFSPIEGIKFSVEGDTKINVVGTDKQKVGEMAAKIKSTKPAEPYKGKGIKYFGEVIRKKAGKAGKVGAAFGAK